jgi:hypothetical protein
MDGSSIGARQSITFFVRTSVEVCQAIMAADSASKAALLGRHLARIEDSRLRSAFRAAVGLDKGSSSFDPPRKGRPGRKELWKGR